jgi:hypothetical protein
MPKAKVQLRNADKRLGYHHGAQMVQASPLFGLVRFNLPYAPVEISYSDVSNKWEEYKRPGDFSILDSSGPSNLKVQMQFRYANPLSSGNTSIEPELNRLRFIGLDPSPVWFVNLDTYLSSPIAPSFILEQFGVRLALFRIADLSVGIKRRDSHNRATQADISISLIEDRNPLIADVALPSISYEETFERAGVIAPGGNATPEQNKFTGISKID